MSNWNIACVVIAVVAIVLAILNAANFGNVPLYPSIILLGIVELVRSTPVIGK